MFDQQFKTRICMCAMYFCFHTLSYFLWQISLGCPLSLLMPSSGSPSATWARTGAACCASNTTERPLAFLALQQRPPDTETECYLPTGSSLCVYVRVCVCVLVCVWQGFKSLHSSCHTWHEIVNMRKVVYCGLWIGLTMLGIHDVKIQNICCLWIFQCQNKWASRRHHKRSHSQIKRFIWRWIECVARCCPGYWWKQDTFSNDEGCNYKSINWLIIFSKIVRVLLSQWNYLLF